MSSTYLSLHYHLVFSTKHREAIIAPEWQTDLHHYLAAIVRSLGGYPECVGGIADHVHLLVGLRATHCLADVVRDLKKSSSMWVHKKIGLSTFAWQEGYAAFTISVSARATVRSYIVNQAEHHQAKSCRDELVEMLVKAGVAYDPKYLD
ncbi:MAG: IS200/IS605 family transposase [Anaerolineae bacterium]|nr:IS200/IS605 family transposase [Anaerolineae bacterium]